MKKFLVKFSGPEACDYAMGCNTTTKEYIAENMEDMIRKIHEALTDESGREDYPHYIKEGMLDSVSIYEVVTIHDVDMSEIEKKFRADAVAEDVRKTEERERQHYEELKKKFG